MVALNDAERAVRLRWLRNHGVTHDPALMTEPDLLDEHGARKPWLYEQVELGFNYRTARCPQRLAYRNPAS